jgi:hypothetical protein
VGRGNGRLLKDRSILHRDGPLPANWQEDPFLAPNVSGIRISGTGTMHHRLDVYPTTRP